MLPDIGAWIDTAARITLGDTFSGQLEKSGDRDWIAVDLTAGQTVQIDLNGTTYYDTYLRLYDGNGQLIAENDDFYSGFLSRLMYQPAVSDTYYIESASYLDRSTGYYELAVKPSTVDVPMAAPAPPAGPLASIIGDTAMGDRVITVYYGKRGESFDGQITGEGFNSYEKARFQAAFDQIEAVADIEFRVVAQEHNADFRLTLDTNEMSPVDLGYFYSPGSFDTSGVGVFNGKVFDRQAGGNMEAGGLGAATIVHELLHGLGLMHPHDNSGGSAIMAGVTADFYDYGKGDLNQGVFTTMSYNPGYDNGLGRYSGNYGNDFGPMALDIAALQLIYGAVDHATGNTAYRLPGQNTGGTAWQAIWDTGGVDTILYDGSQDAGIDLRAATLRQATGGGGYVSAVEGIHGGFTIASGAVIENAQAGSGDDRLSGNSASNSLTGRAGDDVLIGRGRGDDLRGGNGNDSLRGGNGADVLRGNKGSDVLLGGRGADVLIGGNGADIFVFRKWTDSTTQDNRSDTVKGFKAGLDLIDLSAIDGDTTRGGLQALDYNGWRDFDSAGTGALRLERAGGDTRVLVDVDGDGQSDMLVTLRNAVGLSVDDFIL